MDPGLTYAERAEILAKEDGVAVSTMKACLWQAGIVAARVGPGARRRWRPRMAAEYAARYRELPATMTYAEKVAQIKREFKVWHTTVRYALKRMGITSANPSGQPTPG